MKKNVFFCLIALFIFTGCLTSVKDIEVSVPMDLKIGEVTQKTISLSWSAEYADRFIVYRDNGNKFEKIGETSAKSYIDKNLLSGTKYSYKVGSIFGTKVSELSSDISAYTSGGTIKVSVTSVSATTISLEIENLPTIECYEIFRSQTNLDGFSLLTTISAISTSSSSITTTSIFFTDNNLYEGTNYYYKVKPVEKGRDWNASNPISIETLVSAPMNLRLISGDATKIVLTWENHPKGNVYCVKRKVLNEQNNFVDVGYPETNSFIDVNVSDGKTYVYMVAIYDNKAYKTGTFSSTLEVPISYNIDRISNLFTGSVSNDSALVKWSAVSRYDSFEIYRNTTAAGIYTLIGETSKTEYLDNKLTPGNSYYYKVRVKYKGNYGEFSEELKINTLLEKLTVQVKNISTKSIILSTKKPVSYQKLTVLRDSGTGFKEINVTLSESGQDLLIENQLIDIDKGSYYYKIKYEDNNYFESEFSDVVTAEVPLFAPYNLGAQIYGKEVWLTWNSNQGASAYEIYRADGIGEYKLVDKVYTLNFTDVATNYNGVYKYKIRSVDIYGRASEFSAAVTVAVPIETPSNLKILEVESNYITIGWSLNSNLIADYYIYKSIGNENTYKLIGIVSNLFQYKDENLESGKLYSYRIRAISNGVESGLSSVISQQTK